MVLVVCLVVGVVQGERQYVGRLQADIARLTQERDRVRFILSDEQRILRLISQASKGVSDEKRRNRRDSEVARDEIRSSLAAEPSSGVVVPDVAAERVRDAVRAVRGDGASAATR